MPRPHRRGRVDAPALTARGVPLRVPWLRPRWLEIHGGRLAEEHRVYVRLTSPGEAADRWVRHYFTGQDRRVFRIDLREVPNAAALAVRIATGLRPLAPA
ncbi:hypothetical protein ACOXH8_41855 [Nannocystis pusilla]